MSKPEIDLSACGRSILISMIRDLHTRVDELERGRKAIPEEVQDCFSYLFLRIGNWTHSRWDQHLRHEYGDEKTNRFITWLINEGYLKSFPKDASAGFDPASDGTGGE